MDPVANELVKTSRGILRRAVCERLRVEKPSPRETKPQITNLSTNMKILAKLTFTTVAAMTLGATTLFAGPGPIGAPKHEGRPYPAVAPKNCERMTINKNPRVGVNAVTACTKEVKGTLECRLACR
jgi:hypothetical protein